MKCAYVLIHKAGTGLLDSPQTPLRSFSWTCAYRQGNKRDKAERRRAPLSSRLFIQDPIYRSPVGGGRGFAEEKYERGRADVYTDADMMALSPWLRHRRGRAQTLLSHLHSEEKMPARF